MRVIQHDAGDILLALPKQDRQCDQERLMKLRGAMPDCSTSAISRWRQHRRQRRALDGP
jgi:uncharacterized protein YjiS (DUF1127 family)